MFFAIDAVTARSSDYSSSFSLIRSAGFFAAVSVGAAEPPSAGPIESPSSLAASGSGLSFLGSFLGLGNSASSATAGFFDVTSPDPLVAGVEVPEAWLAVP